MAGARAESGIGPVPALRAWNCIALPRFQYSYAQGPVDWDDRPTLEPGEHLCRVIVVHTLSLAWDRSRAYQIHSARGSWLLFAPTHSQNAERRAGQRAALPQATGRFQRHGVRSSIFSYSY